ncbi:MAG: hypothetical protein M3Z05_16155 [Gemmatimonadota bacterium]|nr:hypothetical protein [Gemmatimonadota bacterium]
MTTDTGDAPGDEERARAASQVAERLSHRGVSLTGQETGEQLVTLLETVERFEEAVERAGGDLMMDEPLHDDGDAPIQPDNVAFVLPSRSASESIEDYAMRISEATSRARRAKRPR